MRKALFLIGLAAGVAAMPMTAAAQDHEHHEHGGGNSGGGGHHGGGGGGGGGNRGGGGGSRGPQQAQQQPQAQQQQQQVQQQQAPQRSQWQGNRNDPRMEAARQRYQQLERDNARNYGTPQQTREVIERQRGERQNDRGNWQGGNNNNRPNFNGGRNNDNRPGWNGGNNNRPGWNGGRNGGPGGWNNGGNNNRSGWNGGRGRSNNWNREWRNDRRFDWQRYRNTNRFVFHIQPYYAPYRNWSYTRFGIGMFLDELLYSQNYWINDPWTYRLPPAEEGLHWVRYYNDVVLVDDYTGEVVDVIYDFFW